MNVNNQYCFLQWNDHKNTIISVFDVLLENGSFVDCTLAAEGKSLQAHKMVLSACSPYFASLLSTQVNNSDKHPIFILQDVKFNELRALIDFMYRGEVNILQDQLPGLFKVAKSLQIKGLFDRGITTAAGATLTSTATSTSNIIASNVSSNNDLQKILPDDTQIQVNVPTLRKRKRARLQSVEIITNENQDDETAILNAINNSNEKLKNIGVCDDDENVNIDEKLITLKHEHDSIKEQQYEQQQQQQQQLQQQQQHQPHQQQSHKQIIKVQQQQPQIQQHHVVTDTRKDNSEGILITYDDGNNQTVEELIRQVDQSQDKIFTVIQKATGQMQPELQLKSDKIQQEFDLDDCLLESNDIVITQNKDGFVLHVKKLGDVKTSKLVTVDEQSLQRDQQHQIEHHNLSGESLLSHEEPKDIKPAILTSNIKYAGIGDIELPDGTKIGIDFAPSGLQSEEQGQITSETLQLIPSSSQDHHNQTSSQKNSKNFTILTTTTSSKTIKEQNQSQDTTYYELSISDSSINQYDEVDKPYECRLCGKKYRWKSTLLRHEKVECGGKEPCHKCPYCPYKAKQRGNLGVHVRKHHPEKPQLESTRGRRIKY